MTDAEKERLRMFALPIGRVDIVHRAENIQDIMTDYWLWDHDRWHHLNDWHMGEGKGTTTRGCESDHAWDCLLEVATQFGFERDADANQEKEG